MVPRSIMKAVFMGAKKEARPDLRRTRVARAGSSSLSSGLSAACMLFDKDRSLPLPRASCAMRGRGPPVTGGFVGSKMSGTIWGGLAGAGVSGAASGRGGRTDSRVAPRGVESGTTRFGGSGGSEAVEVSVG